MSYEHQTRFKLPSNIVVSIILNRIVSTSIIIGLDFILIYKRVSDRRYIILCCIDPLVLTNLNVL